MILFVPTMGVELESIRLAYYRRAFTKITRVRQAARLHDCGCSALCVFSVPRFALSLYWSKLAKACVLVAAYYAHLAMSPLLGHCAHGRWLTWTLGCATC